MNHSFSKSSTLSSSSSSKKESSLITTNSSRKPPRPQNPFQRKERDNFPNLESFLRTCPDQSSTAEADNSFLSHDGGCDTSSSVLNISIGARAALNEHLRYVAKHGIDGDHESDDDDHDDDHDVKQPDVMHNALDDQWNYLLDQSTHFDASRDMETDTEISFGPAQSLYRVYANTSSCVEQSIEVMTDVSTDFFNSSRAKALMTPERNQAKRNHVVVRGNEDSHSDVFWDEQFAALAPELQSVSVEPRTDTSASFRSASFHVPDISRISSADDESEVRGGLHRSPSVSEQDLIHNPSSHLGDMGFSPILQGGVASPQALSEKLDTSFPSFTVPVPRGSPPSFPRPRKKSHSKSKRTSRQKENFLPNQNSSALDTLPTDLLQAMEPDATPPVWSPISQAGSSITKLIRESISSSSSDKGRKSRTGRLPRDRTAASSTLLQDTSRGSHSSSGSSSSSTPSLTGRKRFRTVVPRRVYMNSSPSQYPEEHDSFGNQTRSTDVSSSPSLQRSLLTSFEAAM